MKKRRRKAVRTRGQKGGETGVKKIVIGGSKLSLGVDINRKGRGEKLGEAAKKGQRVGSIKQTRTVST